MSLKFYLGASGSGKSSKLEEDIIARSIAEPDRQFILVVPDQFTMQTQKEVVLRHPRHGIMNIDVQSFGRLSHRIADETGRSNRLILDDTGKNLVLRKVAAAIRDDLPTIGSSLGRTGYIHEVKSVISEFEQYGIGPDDIDKLIDFTEGKPFLKGKLKDIKRVFEEMEKFCSGRYITKEEKYDLLAEGIRKSEKLKGSIIAFDGFTGFTPVQNRVITEMLKTCSEVWMSIIMPPEELGSYRSADADHRLFSLSMKTMHSMEQLCADAGCDRLPDEEIFGDPVKRYTGKRALSTLEAGIFREEKICYENDPSDEIKLFVAQDPKAELKEVFLRIKEMTLTGGYAYRDIAVATGDMERYIPYVEEMSAKYGIPVFTDYSRKLDMNPFAEYIRSILECVVMDFSYETVMHFLKTGLTGIEASDADRMENYLIAAGVRGARNWKQAFTRVPGYLRNMDSCADDGEEMKPSVKAMLELNAIREKIWNMISPIYEVRKGTTADKITEALYGVIESHGISGKLGEFAKRFKASGDVVRSKEYEQIFKKICELLEQIHSLLEGEELELDEYLEILQAGIDEITIGVLPLDVDRVLIGDMERTRFKPIKVLFLMGINDGVVPKSNSSGGLISDLDREFLVKSGFALAPTPRQQMFIQRLYLYHVMTRPSELLVLSYSRMDSEGKSVRPSYLLSHIKRLFPMIKEVDSADRSLLDEIPDGSADRLMIARMLSTYAARIIDDEEKKLLFTLLSEEKRRGEAAYVHLVERAFIQYASHPLSDKAVSLLFGNKLKISISRLQAFAECPYKHYLLYGMKLAERETGSFESVDKGSVFHWILEQFGRMLEDEGNDWGSVTDEMADRMLDKLMADAAGEFGAAFLYQDKRTAYQVERMRRILKRSILSMAFQASRGLFIPKGYEVKFKRELKVPDSHEILLRGKIDRLEVFDDGKNCYVKVMDYKSGKKEFSFKDLYYGTQMQLPLYLDEAVRMIKEQDPDKNVVPAALFYFLLKDPFFEEKDSGDKDTVLKKKMRPNGRFSDEAQVLHALDTDPGKESLAVKMEINKGGECSARSGAMSRYEMDSMLEFAGKKMDETGCEILKGEIPVRPFEKACEYCPFGDACPMDKRIKGYGALKAELSNTQARELICNKKKEGADE